MCENGHSVSLCNSHCVLSRGTELCFTCNQLLQATGSQNTHRIMTKFLETGQWHGTGTVQCPQSKFNTPSTTGQVEVQKNLLPTGRYDSTPLYYQQMYLFHLALLVYSRVEGHCLCRTQARQLPCCWALVLAVHLQTDCFFLKYSLSRLYSFTTECCMLCICGL